MLVLVTDSGSNNFTMAPQIQKLLEDHAEEKTKEGDVCQFDWDSMTMHIRCMSHKIGLIVNGGLDALGIGTKRVRHAGLINFPSFEAMDVIEEEDEDQDLPESDILALADMADAQPVLSGDDSDEEELEPEELSWSDDPIPSSDDSDSDADDDDPPTKVASLKKAHRRPTDLHALTTAVSEFFIVFLVFLFRDSQLLSVLYR